MKIGPHLGLLSICFRRWLGKAGIARRDGLKVCGKRAKAMKGTGYLNASQGGGFHRWMVVALEKKADCKRWRQTA